MHRNWIRQPFSTEIRIAMQSRTTNGETGEIALFFSRIGQVDTFSLPNLLQQAAKRTRSPILCQICYNKLRKGLAPRYENALPRFRTFAPFRNLWQTRNQDTIGIVFHGMKGLAMSQLFHDGKFLDFGPSAICPAGTACRAARIEGAKPSALRTQVRLLAPNRPGVYGMLDKDDQLIYVGKAKNLRTRLLSYFRKKGRPPKAGKIISQAKSIVWEIVPSEFASLLRELELIRRWRPRWNVQGQPLRRRLTFVCLGRAPAPYLFLSRKITKRVQAAFGPIIANRNALEATRRLNDWFKLRDCPQPQEMIFPDQGELFPGVRPAGCLRVEIGTCLGPCTGTCERPDYQRQARRARDFLSGKDLAPLQQMHAEMQAAAVAQQFERAAALRDRWTVLNWLADRLARVRRAQQELSFIYPVAGFDGPMTWYLIHGARTVAVLEAPCDDATRRLVAEKTHALYRGRSGLLDSYEHADSMMIVMQWFRKHPREREKCLTPEEALNSSEPEA
jgi:excinuclease ABC subunit C